MKKILISVTTLYGGGAERVATVWANQLVELGYDVHMLVYCRKQNEYYVDNRVKIHALTDTYEEYKKMNYFARLLKMRKIIKRIKPDTVITFLPRMQIWMMGATFGMRVKRIETLRISPWHIGIGNKIEKYLWKTCFKRADTVIFQTEEQAEYFEEEIRKKSVVIRNPIIRQCIDNPKIEYREAAKQFVAVGRITEQKNYPMMIEAFELAMKQKNDIRLYIYGAADYGSDYESYIGNLIAEKGLSDSIQLVGRSNDIASVLNNADGFIMTSNCEGMPNALAEAMAVGLPCISTNCRTGPKDMIDDGKTGFLVNVGDVQGAADAILKITEMNVEDLTNMGNSARTRILELCSEKNSIKVLESVI